MPFFTVDFSGEAAVWASVTVEAEGDEEAKQLAADSIVPADWKIRGIDIRGCEGVRKGKLKVRP